MLNTIRRSCLLVLVSGIAACGGDSSGGEDQTATVPGAPGVPTLESVDRTDPRAVARAYASAKLSCSAAAKTVWLGLTENGTGAGPIAPEDWPQESASCRLNEKREVRAVVQDDDVLPAELGQGQVALKVLKTDGTENSVELGEGPDGFWVTSAEI